MKDKFFKGIMARYYLDTSIWRDYWEDRRDKMRPLGEFAFNFLTKCVQEGHLIIISAAVYDELLRRFGKDAVSNMLSMIAEAGILQEVPITYNETREARKLTRSLHVGFYDALHAVVARDNDAIIITRDAHFNDLNFICAAREPEELL